MHSGITSGNTFYYLSFNFILKGMRCLKQEKTTSEMNSPATDGVNTGERMEAQENG